MRHLHCQYFPEPMGQHCLMARRKYFSDQPDPRLLPYTKIACECCPAGSRREREEAEKRGSVCEKCGVPVSPNSLGSCNKCKRPSKDGKHRHHATDTCQFCGCRIGHNNKSKVCEPCQYDYKRLKKRNLYLSPEELQPKHYK